MDLNKRNKATAAHRARGPVMVTEAGHLLLVEELHVLGRQLPLPVALAGRGLPFQGGPLGEVGAD